VNGLLRFARRVPGFYLLLALLFARRIVVRGGSMYPALRPGERVLFDRLAYRVGIPRSGDVVLARHPERPGTLFIKRVAGQPADDGVRLLGDNPEASTDSRELGPFRRRDIEARGWLVYWPPGRFRLVSDGSDGATVD
jgi:nickel-type superoxide dismutase maturation protease